MTGVILTCGMKSWTLDPEIPLEKLIIKEITNKFQEEIDNEEMPMDSEPEDW